ncbi:tRNA (5-methylaminomethyl-2-thiouridine)(34)-methyltransferase MnmD [Phocaeicola barnesiae]|uniref:tRNA (5-methylaminomethyl-2-thiouridine)(34)-methyltransferase MnmD n=1 Tax=Phocaeicola barnesiae TaxID=376804 RepID=UPI001D1A8C2A|nr:tRNA (5-methylaminomethyl-2-thiouridine)(34)-methyltransferase MnmD [Phocaeicola barnesiae]MCF2597912.1 tRNA (5-methylaminomethyl-2-thiouridine)(34)-methyltransferase MnmD [Phocaeicola barnesiae]HJG78380.1 tRNA (5-methylaminomethyl-2-thiouridine)(34)-methyltransferase MnmD [Phocaeicola barnesiae]
MQIEQTADGSQTLFVPELNEHYHSVKGALTESEHIFIQMGLKHSSVEAPHVLEIGFGTGLNAFLTLLTADTDQRNIHYTTLERYPVTPALIEQLTYPELICPERKDDFQALHQAAWNTDVQLTPYFTLHKVETDFTSYTFPATYDVIYFDAFAPEKQPEMWTQSLFDTLCQQLNPQGILTTYCAKGAVRRMLQAAGFTVERLPGPPGGKREILRATKHL